VIQNTTNNSVMLFDTVTGETITTDPRPRRLSAPTWSRDSRSLILAESTSLLGDLSGSLGRVLLFDPFSGHERMLFWVQSVWGGAHQYVRFERYGDDGLIFDEILWRGNLAEFRLDGSAPSASGRMLTQGHSRDRQPAYAPDGEWIVFSSNRSGNLDVWTLNLGTGELRQITDDGADDWDPAFSADGQSILWSSNRGGNLEIWMADAGGGRSRQITQDGEDAENPTQTADGQWIVYASANPKRSGIWKIRTDGTEEVQIAPGSFILPEVSPDGRYVMYKTTDVENTEEILRVSDLASNEIVFTTRIPFHGFQRQIESGRSRWLPDGSAFVFVRINDAGKSNLSIQDFRPGEDTASSRRVLIESVSDEDIESFGISPDGQRLTVSSFDNFRSLKVASGITGLR
jgi:Tol biopolymer transport system component